MTWQDFIAREAIGNWLGTLALIVALVLLRRFAVRIIRARELSPEEIRRWVINTRNIAIFFGLFGFLLIWGRELHAFALSIAAFVVALVMATKELILCLSGGIYRAGVRSIAIGERIEVAGIRGDVIDKSLMSMTLLEVGPGHSGQKYTGRAVVIPNSTLLVSPVFSETYMERYGFHLFTVTVEKGEDWRRAETLLLEAAHAECAAYLPGAREHFEALRGAHGLPAITVEPLVTLKMKEGGEVDLLLRVPVPLRQSGEVEQAILRAYLLKRGRQTESGK